MLGAVNRGTLVVGVLSPLVYHRRWAELQADRLTIVCRSVFVFRSAYASLRYVDDR